MTKKNLYLAVLSFSCLISNQILVAQPFVAVPSQVERIDALVAEVWSDYEIKPSPKASDGEWCRRLFLDLLGRIPTVDELNKFVSSKENDKRQATR